MLARPLLTSTRFGVTDSTSPRLLKRAWPTITSLLPSRKVLMKKWLGSSSVDVMCVPVVNSS